MNSSVCRFNRVSDYINELREQENIDNFFSNLERYGDIILIGGSIRDIALNGKKPRDIDIIVDTDKESLDDAFVGIQHVRNRFGGYKAVYMEQEFDIWTLANNWAFKSKILDAKVENIPQGCFYNLDSAYFNVTTGKGYADYFESAIYGRRLDIMLEDQYVPSNPFPEVNVIRAIVLRKQYDVSYSNRVRSYIKKWFCEVDNPILELQKAQLKHYKSSRKVSNKELRELKNEILSW
ncbi:hypothetical protein [Paenibacillus sp. PL2-23]|uniref:hypothetical protein n=1 Tax=Paenibacillus sp. PL2-23 TaxID=2100729 RepID=UPI0030FB9DAC